VKTDYDGMQFLSGKKIFLGDLAISGGFCETKTVNGVDVLQLNRTVLKKVSNQAQFVKGFAEMRRFLSAAWKPAI
jgi:hypothetical protein